MIRYQPDTEPTTTTLPAPPPLATPAPAQPVARVNLAGIKKSAAKSKAEYPLFPDATSKAAETAAQIIELSEKFDALDGALASNKKFLGELVRPYYFGSLAGRMEIPSSIAVASPAGQVLVGFQNRYRLLADDAKNGVYYEPRLAAVLGPRVGEFFTQSFTFKIEGDKIPPASARALVEELQALFAKHNALDALSVTDGLKPVPDFHTRRHIALSPEVNLELEQSICPGGLLTIAIKTKGVK